MYWCLTLLHSLIITPRGTNVFPLVLMSLAINFIAKNACFFPLWAECLSNLLMLALRPCFSDVLYLFTFFSALALNSRSLYRVTLSYVLKFLVTFKQTHVYLLTRMKNSWSACIYNCNCGKMTLQFCNYYYFLIVNMFRI